ncbi:transposase [Nostoc commune NIES-4072]|uniref:Transposase n=1 Tax=Nostoc commune NIES-4072 TaxID=2005467 RepID=A0A2R5FFR9_NOSCO|nr:transposase [Nostoc commune HK-02]GBG16925.1 transposase [Nostoc commune NIES-4072]
MKDHKLTRIMLEKSRFNRRLHNLSMLINDLFHQVGMILKQLDENTEYILDSFPVPMCDNIRIFNVRLIQSEQFRGYISLTFCLPMLCNLKVKKAKGKHGFPVH